MSTYAQSIDFLLSQVRTSAGALTGGSVYAYAAGTDELKIIWLDRAKTIQAANPYTLDGNGTAALFGDGLYRLVIKTSAGVTVYDRDNIQIVDPVSGVDDAIAAAVSVYVVGYTTGCDTLAAAVATIGSTRATLQFGADLTIAGNISIPANIELLPVNGAKINHAAYTIEYLGSTARWSLSQIFNGTGTVSGLEESCPEWFGSDTAAFAAAIAASDVIAAGAATYSVDSITLSAGKTLKTAGFATVIQQNAGTAADTRIVNITGSNVTVGDLTVKGQIATDTGEQHHAVFIRSAAAAIDNVRIGNIYAENIRGDALYIGGYTATPTSGIKVGRVYGKNIYRHVVAIAQGRDIQIESIDGSQVSLMALDIEPEVTYGKVRDVRVGYIRGTSLGIQSSSSTNNIGGVKIAFADIAAANDTGSTPAYGGGSWTISATGVTLRNCFDVRFGTLKLNDYADHGIKYVWNAGELSGYGISVDWLEMVNCSKTEATYKASILANSMTDITIKAGVVTPYDSTRRFIYGAVTTLMNIGPLDFGTAATDSAVFVAAPGSTFDGIKMNNAANTYAFQYIDGCTVKNSTITLGRFIGYSAGCTIENSTVTATTLFNVGYDKHWIRNSTLNSDYYASGGTSADAATNYLRAIRFGSYYLWVSSDGKWRTKSTAPASDADGTVIGTQA